MTGRNDPCWCGSGAKWKKCHFPHENPQNKINHFLSLKQKYWDEYKIHLKNTQEIEGVRRSGHLAAEILEQTCQKAQAGITTQQLNDFAYNLHIKHGAVPAPLNYGSPPFPKSICTSLNEVICHGIPDNKPLIEGDILNIDVTSILNGFYGDCSRMVVIGSTTPERQLVVDVAYECLMRSIAILKPGMAICEIGREIETYAHSRGCSVVNQFIGHGVGLKFHENPQIPHCYNTIQTPLAPGMIFTIEPMINAGVREAVIDPHDQWTARTKDGKASAQWEHTILITETGYEILTPWKR